jgi:deoxyribonuclease-4
MALQLGSHVSISNGLIGAAKEAHSYGADTFMIYTGAPQNTRRKPIEELKIEEGRAYMEENGLKGPIVHAPYIINMGSYKDNIYTLAIDFFKQEISRAEALGAEYIVVHPGSFTDKDVDFGTNQVANALNQILVPEQSIMVCLETMAGKGTEIGRNFSELQSIIEKVHLQDKIGICFDTCHTHDSGYPIIDDFESVLAEFDSIIGLDRIKVFHINGSLNPQGAKKDRHANLGADDTNKKGMDFIGKKAIHHIVHHPICQDKPLILETPWLDAKTNLYAEEILFLRKEDYDAE